MTVSYWKSLSVPFCGTVQTSARCLHHAYQRDWLVWSWAGAPTKTSAECMSCLLAFYFCKYLIFLIYSPLPVLGLHIPEWNVPTSPSSDPPVTHTSEKDNSWLYTLDPILVTIIVMSSLGVLLGAVCAGLLLYCTCSYSGLSSRSSTTLENYNFELYDGLKHKVKLNQQRCCTEAWEKWWGKDTGILWKSLSIFFIFANFSVPQWWRSQWELVWKTKHRPVLAFVSANASTTERPGLPPSTASLQGWQASNTEYQHISIAESWVTKRELLLNAS